MPILAIHRGDGITKEIYENARKEVNWEGNPPPGVIFHAASSCNRVVSEYTRLSFCYIEY
jgi:hypothetical protein